MKLLSVKAPALHTVFSCNKCGQVHEGKRDEFKRSWLVGALKCPGCGSTDGTSHEVKRTPDFAPPQPKPRMSPSPPPPPPYPHWKMKWR